MHFVIHMLWWTSQNFPSDWYLCITKIKKITLKPNTWWNTHFDMLWGLWWVISTSFPYASNCRRWIRTRTESYFQNGLSYYWKKYVFLRTTPTNARYCKQSHSVFQFGLYSFRKILKYVCFVTTKKKFKICILKKNI